MTDTVVRVLIPSYRPDREQLQELMEAFSAAGTEPLVIANGSTALSTAQDAGLPLLDPGVNAGFGPSIDWAVERLETWDWVLLANDDLIIEPSRFATALRGATRSSGAVVVHLDDESERPIPGLLDALANVSLLARVVERARPRTPTAGKGYRSFSCVLISKAAWTETGGFDERLPFTYEDADFTRRLQTAGGRIEHAAHSGVRHERSKTSSRAVRSVLPVSTWSALVYLQVWTPVPQPVLRLLLGLALVVRLVLAPLGRAPLQAHLAGILAAIRSMICGQAPPMPPYLNPN